MSHRALWAAQKLTDFYTVNCIIIITIIRIIIRIIMYIYKTADASAQLVWAHSM
jgi:hypothetical protein